MPNFVYQGGPLLGAVELSLVFASVNQNSIIAGWSDPATGELSELVSQINDFAEDLVDSAYMDLLSSEYSVLNGPSIHRGTFRGTYFHLLPTAQPVVAPDYIVTDADITQFIDDSVLHGRLPLPTTNSCYCVCIPHGCVVTWGGLRSDHDFNGYHNSFVLSNGIRVSYIVLPYIRNLLEYTFALSHEIAEAVTDPTLTTGWIDVSSNSPKEIADVCGQANFHGYLVCQFFSRRTNQCIGPVDDGLQKPKPKTTVHVKHGTTCFGSAIEGTNVILAAQAVRSGTAEALHNFNWTASNAAILGPHNQATVTVVAPPAPTKFTVTVNAFDALGYSMSASVTLQSVAAGTGQQQNVLCQLIERLREIAVIHFHVDPLWDPLRDLTTHPLSALEVEHLRLFRDELTNTLRVLDELKIGARNRSK